MGVLSPTWFCQAEKPQTQFRAHVPATIATAGFRGHHPTSLDPNSSQVFIWNAGRAEALAHSCPPACNALAQSRCFSKRLTEHDCRALVGSEPAQGSTWGAGGRQSMCPPPELPSQALQCLSGSGSGAGRGQVGTGTPCPMLPTLPKVCQLW